MCVTGRARFLGSFVVKKIAPAWGNRHIRALIKKFDLLKLEDIGRVLVVSRPDLIIHLGAHVGGIGANREHPAELFYDNLMGPAPTAGAGWVHN